MKYNGRFTSKTAMWGTPPELFRLYNEVYDFQLDAAASDGNALCTNYFTSESDALLQDWSPYRRVWLNPPYGKGIEKWMRKAYEESQRGYIVVCFVPVRVDTEWWHDWVYNKAKVTFIRGRLKFVKLEIANDSKIGKAPFASALVTYVPHPCLPTQHSDQPIVVNPNSDCTIKNNNGVRCYDTS